MPNQNSQNDKSSTVSGQPPLGSRMARWTTHAWRPAASVVVLGFALMLGWHVVNGNHGLATWQQKRAEDRKLRKEIDDLQQENAKLRVRVQRLGSDQDAIAHEAREKLQYVKKNEVIVKLPPQQVAPSQPSAK